MLSHREVLDTDPVPGTAHIPVPEQRRHMKELGWSQLVPGQMPWLCPCWSLGWAVPRLAIHTGWRRRELACPPPGHRSARFAAPQVGAGDGGCPGSTQPWGRGKNSPWAGSSPLWLPAIYSPSWGGGKRRQELAWFTLTLSPPAEKVPEGPFLPPFPSLDGAGSWGRGLEPHPASWGGCRRRNCWSGHGFSVPFLIPCMLGRDKETQSCLGGGRDLCCRSQNPGQAPTRRWKKEESWQR